MWISREQAAVFALVLTMAWAESLCDLSKMETMDPSVLNGIIYPVLATGARSGGNKGRMGYNFQPFTKNCEQYIKITLYFMAENKQTCRQIQTECKISDNACRYSSGIGFYEVAHGDKYHVLYVDKGSGAYTLGIYTKDFQGPITIEDLPENIRCKIEAACGSDSVKADFYGRQYTPGNFIPNC